MENTEVLLATQVAQEAGTILLSYMSPERMGARDKGDRDVVTEADFASETHIRNRLMAAYPADGIVGEEGTGDRLNADRCWYVDPLDGTLNFSRGVPMWCVSIALVERGQPIVGVVRDPIRGETFSCASGQGSRLNDIPIGCRRDAETRDSFVHVTVDFHEGSMTAGLEDLTAMAPAVLRTRNIGSAALALAYVAAGRFDAMVHRYANSWDYAAGVLLIREAGGEVTQMDGSPYVIDSRSVLAAANAHVHSGLQALARS